MPPHHVLVEEDIIGGRYLAFSVLEPFPFRPVMLVKGFKDDCHVALESACERGHKRTFEFYLE